MSLFQMKPHFTEHKIGKKMKENCCFTALQQSVALYGAKTHKIGKINFSAMDRLKYKRLWPRYTADMHALKTDHPDTWRELDEGNISVTKAPSLSCQLVLTTHANSSTDS